MIIRLKQHPKNVIKLSAIVFSVLFIAFFIYKQTHYVKLSEVEQYVEDNNAYLTKFAEQLLEKQEKTVAIYKYRMELPKNINSHRLYFDLRVREIYVGKNHLDDEDIVCILLKNKNGNYSCGIYYSPSGKLLEYGTPKEGDKYEYDGMEEGIRHRYRSEKICDNWYYYEDDTWN